MTADNFKTISPAAIIALKEALTNIYWYKSELRSFLTNTLSNPLLLSKINWEEYKRNIVGVVVDFLAKNQNQYQNDLIKLIREVCAIEDFSHLEKLEDGVEKAKLAKKSVEALKKMYFVHRSVDDEQKAIEKRRKSAYEKSLKQKAIQDELETLKQLIYQILEDGTTEQQRGFLLEKILKSLFEIFDLDPKASFKITGEQIDGAFTFDNTDYILEAKWQKPLIALKELDVFNGKIGRKLDNTLGLFISINGFFPDAVKAFSSGRPTMILMDGSDLMAVLEGRIDLIQLLLRKRRHASQTGEIYLPLHKIYEA